MKGEVVALGLQGERATGGGGIRLRGKGVKSRRVKCTGWRSVEGFIFLNQNFGQM